MGRAYTDPKGDLTIARYDIIPDIHADIDRLKTTLNALGYHPSGGSWQHPDGRLAAFLGDFIDTGTSNRQVIELVRAMMEDGNAVAVMGNHELNALHFHSKGENWLNVADGYMRAHVPKNIKQHQAFIDEFPVGSAGAAEVMAWFLTLPLFLDLGDMRMVHACWNAEDIALISERRPDGRLLEEDLQETALQKTPFGLAVVNALKGPETSLPEGHGFYDKGGTWRTEVRLKWWGDAGTTWREAALSVPDPSTLPDGPLPKGIASGLYAPDEPPVFFGHYKRHRRPEVPDAGNVMCLDYPSHPSAYRWAGESTLDATSIVVG